ncbi:MAG TPA: ATP-binding protein [Vicinamibacterales bacterium]|jgi:signal transduction histidine kinase|nr:ATP-binding protein [Vicinamibacterales bacterium]
MPLSIKQKQVLGVTTIVVLVVMGLSVLQIGTLVRVLLQQAATRAEVVAASVIHQTSGAVLSRETAYQDIRSSTTVLSALESAMYSPEVQYAAILDPTRTVVAANDPAQVGRTLPRGEDLPTLVVAPGYEQVRAVYTQGRTLEWRQPLALGDEPFGEISIGLSMVLIRNELIQSLRPAAIAVGLALVIAVSVAMLLAQVVLRPIHVITSGLTRLGRGELGKPLDLRDEEFRDLGDVFDQVSAQLQSAVGDGPKRAQLADLTRRVASLGRLTAGVAHEVKNPLNAMTIHLELLKQKLASPDPGAAARHAEVIGLEIRRLDDVVQGFLKFVRPEDVTLGPVKTGTLIANVLEAVVPEAERSGVSCENNCQEPHLAIEGDETLLRQAFLNLAQNAIQAMPRGGRLRIICGVGRDGRVEVRVQDTGDGIPPEHLARIFDLYFTTKKRGSGIGLSLVFRTVQLHNGDIDVESTVGTGTTFVIKLPRAR